MIKNRKSGIAFAVLAAVLYAINSPLSKILLDYMPPTLMAGFLYAGAGVGMIFISLLRKAGKVKTKEAGLTKKELPFTVAMIVLDIAAPVFLLIGLSGTSAANASLLNNFEIVATAVIAMFVFKEAIDKRLWVGIFFVTLSCVLLSLEDIQSLKFSKGSLFVILAAVCWGFENNCTRKISSKDPLQIVLLKGIFSGGGSIIIGFIIGERLQNVWSIFAVMLVGLFAYGMSIFFYIYAQRILGAARTSAYYAVAPFVGSALSLLIFKTVPSALFFAALLCMIIGARLSC